MQLPLDQLISNSHESTEQQMADAGLAQWVLSSAYLGATDSSNAAELTNRNPETCRHTCTWNTRTPDLARYARSPVSTKWRNRGIVHKSFG